MEEIKNHLTGIVVEINHQMAMLEVRKLMPELTVFERMDILIEKGSLLGKLDTINRILEDYKKKEDETDRTT